MFQVIRSSLLLLIIDLCESFSLDQISLILKLVLMCIRTLSVGHIQTRHVNLLPPYVCRISWQGYLFLLFHLSSSIHILASRRFLKFVTGSFYIKVTEDCSFCWCYIIESYRGESMPIGLIPGKKLVGYWRLINKPCRNIFLFVGVLDKIHPKGQQISLN